MPITDNKNYFFSFSMIDIKKIDPSPYEHRKYFAKNLIEKMFRLPLLVSLRFNTVENVYTSVVLVKKI